MMVKPVIPSITHSTGVVLYENIYQTSQVTIKEGTEIEFHYTAAFSYSFFHSFGGEGENWDWLKYFLSFLIEC